MLGTSSSSPKGYILATTAGAVVGGLGVALATKAVPEMMSRMMDVMSEH